MAVCHRPSAEILVAVPTRGQVQWATVTRLQEIRDRERGLAPIVYQPGHLSVAATRNLIAQRFLAGPWKVLVMADDDVVPHERLLQIVDLIPEFGVVGVPTLTGMNGHGIVPAVVDRLGRLVRSADGVVEVGSVGFGCVAVSRELLVAAGEQPFQVGWRDGVVVSDDVLFCEWTRTQGVRVGADFRIAADHHTTVSLAALAGLGG